jgi:hypothetical protein
LFSQIKHLELVALGSLQFTKTASAIGKSLSEAHSQFLLSGLQSLHVTEEYNERSCFGPLDDDGYPYCHFTDQEAVLAPLCAPHKLCICIPKEDRWVERIHLTGATFFAFAGIRLQVDKALRRGVRSMLGSRSPQQRINATAITYHNANKRYVVPPQSGQVTCNYNLSYIPHNTIFSGDDREDHTTMPQRAQQIAEFLMVLYGPDRPFPSPGSIAIFRPLSMTPKGRRLDDLKSRVQSLVVEASKSWPEPARSIFLYWVNEVQWLAESVHTKLGDCDVCGGECRVRAG